MIAKAYIAQNGHNKRICQPAILSPSGSPFKLASQTVLVVSFLCPKYCKNILIFNFSYPSERIWNHWRRSCSFFRIICCWIDYSSRSWWEIFSSDLVLVLMFDCNCFLCSNAALTTNLCLLFSPCQWFNLIYFTQKGVGAAATAVTGGALVSRAMCTAPFCT